MTWLLWVECGRSPVSIPGRHPFQEQGERDEFKTGSRSLALVGGKMSRRGPMSTILCSSGSAMPLFLALQNTSPQPVLGWMHCVPMAIPEKLSD